MRETSPDTQIFWVHAGDSTRFEQSYRSIANMAKLPGADDPKTDILGLVYRWLENDIRGDWLMILDNADDADVFFTQHDLRIPQRRDSIGRASSLSSYLPQSSGGLILITTRNRAAGSQLTGKADRVIKVGHMEEEDANELLMKKLPHDQSLKNDRNELVNALERLPLAITQAAAYIAVKMPRMTISKYLESFRRSETNQILLLSKDGGDLRRDPEVPNAVVITWQISFDQIKLQNAPAADLLSCMCVFDRQEIPRFLIREDDEDDLVFEDAIGTLIEFSFVAALEDEDNFEMHPLVQLSTRKWLEIHGEMEQRKEEALSLLAQKYPPGEPTYWKICEALEPHAQAVLKYHYATKHHRLERARVLHNSAWYAWARGDYGKAKGRIEEAAETRKELLDTDDRETLDSLGLLASILDSQGRWTEAEKLKVQVMETSLRVLGQEHLSTLTSMSNLALIYWNQGRWTEAEKLNMQVMETRKRVLGQEHPSTLTSMANLASTYQYQGRWTETEKLNMQVMETRKRVLGQEHPSTLISIATLVLTYQYQGRWTEAEKLGMQVMKTSLRVLGQEHPNTLTIMANLASTYQYQGRWMEAEKLGMQVMETRKRVLGQEHLDTLTSMSNLASIYQDQDRRTEEEKLNVQVMETSLKVLGQEHPFTLTSISNLALTYRYQGRLTEAEKLNAQAMETNLRVLGQEHPNTLTIMANLALIYWNQGRWTEAEKLGMQVMETRKRVLGQEHPSTLTSMANLAYTWKSQGRNKEAIELLKQAERLRKEKLGSDHYLTIDSTQTLQSWQTSSDTIASPSTSSDI
jgi:tetratricopeptide (TPR) repeat protein